MKWLHKANELIASNCGTINGTSSIYQTAAWGVTTQPDFLNFVTCISTPLPATSLLTAILEIETGLGRKRDEKWGPRTIDIDILLFNDEIVNLPELIIPHPFMHIRRFTLTPLAEIAPDYIHPVFHKSIAQLLAECPDSLEVTAKSK